MPFCKGHPSNDLLNLITQAVQQMEERLRLFIAEHTTIPHSDEGDGTLCFVHKQIINLAHDCLEKCSNQLLSALYFHELSENLRQLSVDVSVTAISTIARETSSKLE